MVQNKLLSLLIPKLPSIPSSESNEMSSVKTLDAQARNLNVLLRFSFSLIIHLQILQHT